MGNILDQAVKPLAWVLQRGHLKTLGIRNTMRIAGAYNQFRYKDGIARRRSQYRDHFDELIQENGAPRTPPIKINDGWALDTSHTLPHLDQLLEEAAAVIKERGLKPTKKPGEYRSFFQSILTPQDLEQYPSFLNFMTSSEVLAPLCHYLETIPVLSTTLPPGVRLAESSSQFDSHPKGSYRDSQLFHIDYYALPLVYVIVLLRDVTMENGPFCFLPISTSQKTAAAINYWSRGKNYRVSDEEIYAVTPREEVKVLTYPKGTVLFIESSRCFHFGSRDAVKPRYMMMYGFSSQRRTEFSEILMNQWTIKTNGRDSRLRKMVLNKCYNA